MTTKRRTPESFLPLAPPSFHILVSLGDEEMHAYAILKDVERRSDGKVRFSASTLYDAVQRLQTNGLIEESQRRPIPSLDDGRRKYFRLTRLGRAVGAAEANRLEHAVRMARSTRFLSSEPSLGAAE